MVNGLLVGDPAEDPAALAFSERQSLALAGAPAQLAGLPIAAVALIAGDITGVQALRRLAGTAAHTPDGAHDSAHIELPGLDELVDELDAAGHGV